MDDVAQSRLGRTLRGKYQLDRVLGVGGMATVYAATHRNRKQFAIKMLHPELSNSEAVRTRFLREGYVANSVNHRGAVAVLDDDVAEDGSAFLVMELLDGLTAEQLWERRGRSLPIPIVFALADQLLDVLATAHRNGVIHRDLKPANLFLTCDGTVKVLDFGIARLRDAESGSATATGTTLGTPAYMAPEQALGKTTELDAKTDLWAAGATLFSLISGELVHEGENTYQLLLHAATRPARPLRSVALGVPESVSAVIDRALAFDKQHRWASASEMRSALRDAHTKAFGKAIDAGSLALAVGALATAPSLTEVAPSADAAPAARPPVHGGAAPQAVQQHEAVAQVATPVALPHAAPAIVEVNIAAAQVAPAPRIVWPWVALAALALGALLVTQYPGLVRREPSEQVRPEALVMPASPTAAEPKVGLPARSEPAAAEPHTANQAPTAIAPAAAPLPSQKVATGASAPKTLPTARPRLQPSAASAPREPAAAPPLPPICARLLERQSLGETLTPDERTLFAQRCHR